MGATTYNGTNEVIVNDTSYTFDITLPANAPFGAYDLDKDGVVASGIFHVVPCTNCGTISGTVWNDSNGNGI